MERLLVACVELGLCCVNTPTLILQTVGLFTAHWVSNSTCDSVGLLYSCCSGHDNNTCENTNGGNELHARVLGLEVTACAMMMIAEAMVIVGICIECKNADARDVTDLTKYVMGCCLLFSIAGILSFIGCMIIASDFSTSQLGWSFYLCLVSGSLIILFILLVLIYLFRLKFSS